MAGTIIADFIRTDANRLSLQVGNTTFATINAMGLLSNTGNVLVSQTGAITANNISVGRIVTPSVMPTGSVLQVVNTYYTTPVSQSISSGVITAITGLEASITPASTSSKILIFVRWFGEHSINGNNWDSIFGITRDGTAIGLPPTNSGSYLGMSMSSLTYYASDASSTPETAFYNYIDSPSTTSSVSYRASFQTFTAETLYTNRTLNADGAYNYERGTSSIILMEIAG